MNHKYFFYFVPHLSERKKFSSLRQKISKKVHSTEAQQSPVHMSLISSGFYTDNIEGVVKELESFCKTQKAMILHAEEKTSVLPKIYWAGIHIVESKDLNRMRKELQKIRNTFAHKKEEHTMNPCHITLAFPARVKDLVPEKTPVTEMVFDRVTIGRKENGVGKYKIRKHIRFTG